MAKDLQKIFAGLVEDMANADQGDDFLQVCMSLDQEKIRHVPLRYRLIAMGFARRMNLDEVNDLLLSHGSPALYSRSFWEATLIFAFLHRFSYDQWLEVRSAVADLSPNTAEDPWFPGGKLTYGELERYVTGQSLTGGEAPVTASYTVALLSALEHTGDRIGNLRSFLEENLHAFSDVREKTRYYFCKYLYFYLRQRVERYFEACRRGQSIEDALDDLLCLKTVTVLRRNLTMPEDEKRARIHSSAISCGEIFSAFSFFFFDFVSLDWVEELMDLYGRPEAIPVRHKKVLADIFRKGRRGWKKLSDDEVLERITRMQEEQKESEKAYGRSGENAVYGYIQGRKDIDRLTLMCFLLFFASNTSLPPSQKLDVGRMNTILLRCGYSILDPEEATDWFVVEFLESDEKMEFMQDVLSAYAEHHENSFLYRMYGNSVQYADELARILLRTASDPKKEHLS